MGCAISIPELQQNGVVLTNPAFAPLNGTIPGIDFEALLLFDASTLQLLLDQVVFGADEDELAEQGFFNSVSFKCPPGSTLLHQGNVVNGGQFTFVCNNPINLTAIDMENDQSEDLLEDQVDVFSTNLTCTGDSGIMGDPHIKKWNGEWYDWHGECDTVFLHAPDFHDGLGLDLHARTKLQYGYSYIESAALRLGEDILEVSSYGEYFLNDVEAAKLPSLMAGQFPVTHHNHMAGGVVDVKKQTFLVDLGHNTTIELKTQKQIVSIKITHGNSPVVNEWFGSSSGLMGSFFESKSLARDGVTVLEDPNDFGQEWQVLDSDPLLFQNPHRIPQFPEKCRLPHARDKSRHLLEGGISRDEAVKACAHWKVDERENCVADVLAMNDIDFAKESGY